MATIQTTGQFRQDRIAVISAMLWPLPDQQVKREQFAAASAVNDLLGTGEQSLTIDAPLLEALLHAPSWEELGREVEEQTRKATIAGYVMSFMFIMDRYSDKMPRRGEDGGSLDKAFFCATEWAREGHSYRDGRPIQASDGRVKKCWQEFRSVAHFWAAKELNKATLAVPQQAIFQEQHFPVFLQSAAYLQCYGLSRELTNKSKSGSRNLLSPEETWSLDIARYRPEIQLPADDESVLLAPFVQYLKRYVAK